MDFYGFFSSMNVIVYELFFRVLSTSQVAYIRLKKCGLLRSFSPPGAKRDAPLVLEIVAEELKSFLCAILSLCFRIYYGYVSVVWYD